MLSGDTQRVKPAVTENDKAIQDYLFYLESTGVFAARWLAVERSWAAQQPPGAIAHLLHCIKIIRDAQEE